MPCFRSCPLLARYRAHLSGSAHWINGVRGVAVRLLPSLACGARSSDRDVDGVRGIIGPTAGGTAGAVVDGDDGAVFEYDTAGAGGGCAAADGRAGVAATGDCTGGEGGIAAWGNTGLEGNRGGGSSP